MARFRLFGRPGGPDAPASDRPEPAAARPDFTSPWGVAPVGAGVPWPRSAPEPGSSGPQPAKWEVSPWPPLSLPARSPYDDPPTDPFGFPPVPAAPHAAPEVDAGEASALAAAFALDYLSWDEDDPERRGRVLLDYLAAPGRDPARLGWTGHGRQRAELALPGRVRPDGDGRVLVDLRVRVTPYRAVGEHGPTAEPAEPGVSGVPAAAPAPTGRGWRSLASSWIRLSVPITDDGRRLVVDAWEETLGEEPLPRPPVRLRQDDPTLADDDDPPGDPRVHPSVRRPIPSVRPIEVAVPGGPA